MQLSQTMKRTVLASAIALALPMAAMAQVKVGITVASTGPAASLGIPERNTVSLLPTEVAGQKVEYIVLDDGTDTTVAVRNMRKLITEDNVDVVIGTSVTPGSLAMVDVAGETKTPMISVAANARIVEPVEGAREWVFKTPQNDQLMAAALADAMEKQGVKTLGFIGFNDAYGDGWLDVMTKAAEAKGIKMTAVERYNRNDTSVTGPVLKLTAANPDGILIAGAGTPVALPQGEIMNRGYKGKLYHTHGSANNDVLRVCGKDCEGMILPAGPLLVADQLPDDNTVKASAIEYKKLYEGKYGDGSINTFGGHMWDAALLVHDAIPRALESGAKPGTAEFRAALRDALEKTSDLAASQGVFTMSADDHAGLDERARVMVKIEGGKWAYQPDL
ncbi:branched-chain amino acid ABC transporter substrate-binding protein [Paenalcaligenes hominis]|uniref:Branched-chain amino acid ABC transporter substrate-binding protein n=1 Tax=Paenalcaligenes hominis TaxID=643674 RepID=A0A1U9JZF5_9BURK|nr:ABC transporter substrate-binding protein [Paenalcaligenes hominis]AQS51124.1 branched-chain amino acid ABC transporter substrate-binding protein [Paenalcaligenes hominis]